MRRDAITLDVAIARPWQEVYDAAWRPEAFARWASGLAAGNLRHEGGVWRADGPAGPITITFTPYNAFGVMDHHVDTGAPTRVFVPMRVLANGDGTLVTLTLYRQSGMSDDEFARDRAWVRRDRRRCAHG